jgi:5-hydroxyisourate hydrolase-like protein (transthyretin family)
MRLLLAALSFSLVAAQPMPRMRPPQPGSPQPGSPQLTSPQAGESGGARSGRGGFSPNGQSSVAPVELKPEDYALISGQVTSGTDGAPLRKATLTLRQTDSGRRGAPLSASTGDGGVFLFDKVAPGRYKLHIERNGFVGQDYGARRPGGAGQEVTVEKGGRVTGLQAKLLPQGVVTGHVRDEDGEPMAGVRVQVYRWGYAQGRRQLMPQDSDTTDDRGEYRIYGVAPGKYVVSASSQRGFRPDGPTSAAPPEQRGNEETYLTVYYPGTLEPAQAATAEVAAGATLQGIDFNLRKVRTVRVTGKVLRATVDNNRARPLMITLVAKGSALMPGMNAPRTMSGATGTFELRGVRPGSYTLHADEMDRNVRLTADVPVEVGAAGLDNVIVQLAPGLDMSGSFVIEESPDTPKANLGAWLRSRGSTAGGPFNGGLNTRAGEDGTFKLTGVSPGEYDLSVTGLPEGFYLKSIRAGDVETINTGLTVMPGAAPVLTIVARPYAGTVDGSVKNKDGQPVTGSTVVLWPTAKNARSVLFKTATTDAQGRYTFSSVAPGDYRLAAFEFLEPGAAQDPEFLSAFEAKAEKLSIQEKGRETKALVEIIE